MAKQVALLRGINVGRAKRLAMADLRAAVEDLGFRDVRSLLNSGNVVFEAGRSRAAANAPRISAAVLARTGVACKVIVLAADEFNDIIAANPLLDVAEDAQRLLVIVLGPDAPLAHLYAMLERDWSPEHIAAGPRTAYLWCATGILQSRAAGALHAGLADHATTRNWATLLKIKALLDQ